MCSLMAPRLKWERSEEEEEEEEELIGRRRTVSRGGDSHDRDEIARQDQVGAACRVAGRRFALRSQGGADLGRTTNAHIHTRIYGVHACVEPGWESLRGGQVFGCGDLVE